MNTNTPPKLKACFPLEGNKPDLIDEVAAHYNLVAYLKEGYFILTGTAIEVAHAMSVFDGGAIA